jgi:hypothetical protein
MLRRPEELQYIMNRPQALFTYDGLPISSGGAHRIRIRDHRIIWKAVSLFLQTFTTPQTAEDVHLILYEDRRVEPSFFARALERAVQVYGSPQRRLAVSGSVEVYQNAWMLGYEGISAAIDLMASLEPFPDHWLGGPMFLGVKSTFCLRYAGTSQPLPLQGSDVYGVQEAAFRLPLGISILYLRLAHPSTCGLFLSLPFTDITSAVQIYVRNLESSLPFKLSSKHWSRWQLNAQGTRYYKRKASISGSA